MVDLCLPMSPSGAALLCCFRDPGSPRKTAAPVVTGIVITSFCPGSHFFLFQFHVSFALFQRSRFYPHNTPLPSKPPLFFPSVSVFVVFVFLAQPTLNKCNPLAVAKKVGGAAAPFSLSGHISTVCALLKMSDVCVMCVACGSVCSRHENVSLFSNYFLGQP